MLAIEQRSLLRDGARAWGLYLDDDTVKRFDRFALLLYDANIHLNLTRVTPEQVVPLHFLDSLSVAAAIDLKPGITALDLGTGAGFPGIPLALAVPGISWTLVDATRKKVDFVQSVIKALGVTNAKA